jgi:hypothetical protein
MVLKHTALNSMFRKGGSLPLAPALRASATPSPGVIPPDPHLGDTSPAAPAAFGRASGPKIGEITAGLAPGGA